MLFLAGKRPGASKMRRDASNAQVRKEMATRGPPVLDFVPPEVSEYYVDDSTRDGRDDDDDMDSEDENTPTITYQAILPWDETRKIIATQTFKNGESKRITIPYGFQRIRRLLHGKTQKLQSVLFVPKTTSSEYIVTLDPASMHIWKGSTRVKRISLFDATLNNQARIEDASKSGIRDIRHWIFLEKYKVYLVASSSMQLRVCIHRSTNRGCSCSTNNSRKSFL